MREYTIYIHIHELLPGTIRVTGFELRSYPSAEGAHCRYDNEEEEKKKEIAYRVALFAAETLVFVDD